MLESTHQVSSIKRHVSRLVLRFLIERFSIQREVHAISHPACRLLCTVGYPGAIQRMPGRAGTATRAACCYPSGAAAQRGTIGYTTCHGHSAPNCHTST